MAEIISRSEPRLQRFFSAVQQGDNRRKGRLPFTKADTSTSGPEVEGEHKAALQARELERTLAVITEEQDLIYVPP